MMRQYIAATNKEYNTIKKHLCAPLFRKKFDCEKTGESVLEISAAGFYRVFLNRKELTKGFLAPYISNPDHVVYYDEYSLDGVLKKQDNELWVLLGNGFNNVNDNGIWNFEDASFRSAPKFYLSIYVDGEQIITTDETFGVYSSPITFDDLHCGEWYDARLEKTMFETQSKPVLVEAPKGEYRRCMAQPITLEKEMKPVAISKGTDGYLYDFGENNTGIFRLAIDGVEGQIIDLSFTELRDGNNPDKRSISFGERSVEDYIQHDRYICKDGIQEYIPSFTYHGFQYVYVQGIAEEQATDTLLTYLVIHSNIEQRAKFQCSNETINKIQECVLRSDISNFHYFPTDCPHREKNGWTGDIAVSAEQLAYNFDTYNSLREWLHMVRKSQLKSGEIAGIVPTTGWGYAWGNGLVWDNVLVEVPYQLYRFHGKQEIVEENAEAIWRYLGYMKSMRNSDGLFAYGLGDWCEAGAVREDVCKTPLEVTASLSAIDFFQKASVLFHIVGQEDKANEVETLEIDVKAAFRRKFVNNDVVSCLSQTAQSMALILGIFEEDERDIAYQELLKIIEKDNNRFCIGIVGARYLFDVLSEFGNSELALKLVADPAFPSYGYLINRGATTLWEAFHDYKKSGGRIERKDGEPHMVSFNHHFYGSVSTWFFQRLAGLNVISAKEISISPCIECGLEWVEAEYHNEYGNVQLFWKKNKGSVILKIDNRGFEGTVCFRDICEPLADGTREYT